MTLRMALKVSSMLRTLQPSWRMLHPELVQGAERSDLEKTLQKLGFRLTKEETTEEERRHRALAAMCFIEMKQLFPAKNRQSAYKIHPQHLGLPAVLRHVFVAQEELLKRSAQGVKENYSMKEAMKKAEACTTWMRGQFDTQSLMLGHHRWKRIGFHEKHISHDSRPLVCCGSDFQAWLRMKICGPRALKVSRFLQTITNKKPFIVFFFVLTMYILIFPDLINIFTNSDADVPLLWMNTVIFFLRLGAIRSRFDEDSQVFAVVGLQ
eukprot:g12315.t1